MKKYDPKIIEPKWQQTWSDTKLYAAIDGDKTRPKYYMLTEFPYPSGDGLHAGHTREYTLGDVIARHKRMQGHNVLYPMGWDAFGLPTENFAIKHKIKPQDATSKNTAVFRGQMQSLGLGIDWDRMVNTTDPDYYKWTQWLFLQFLKHGLAYQDEIAINWCPFEKTGLANEEVVNGVHERCGTPVEKKLLRQWMLKITTYADRLIEGLKTVDYPSRIADQQINWIGRSEGAEIDFHINAPENSEESLITVFTTRPDTLGGATFLVLSPEHPGVAKITTPEQRKHVEEYVKASQAETELDRQAEERPKTGVFTGAYAQNPITKEKMPVWIADYVLAGYGTGAIMSVPAHDERDFAFAKAHSIPVIRAIEPKFVATEGHSAVKEGLEFTKREVIVAVIKNPKTGEYLCVRWKHHQMNGLVTGGVEEGEDPVEAALREIHEETGYKHVRLTGDPGVYIHSLFYHRQKQLNRWARFHVLFFELENEERDPVDPEEAALMDLVWKKKVDLRGFFTVIEGKYVADLLEHGEGIFTGEGPLVHSGQFDGLEGTEAKRAIVEWLFDQGLGRGSTKYKLHDWIFSRQHYWGEPIPVIHCPKDGAVPVPDDQLPVKLPEVDHYEPTDTGESPLASIADWVNVECPKCGGPAKRETDTMPNWAGSSWYWLRYMDPHNDRAFADPEKMKYWGQVDLYLGGMEHTTLHLLYARFWHQFLYDQKLVPTPEPFAARRGQGIVLAADGRKMSKSLGNVINPTDIIARYGADALRLYIMFMAPYDEATPWSDERLNGVSRFLYRAWGLVQELIQNNTPSSEPDGTLVTAVDRITHKTIKKVHDDLESMRFNTMVSALMEFVNFLNEPKAKAALLSPANAGLAQRTARTLILLLAPAAPHMAEELWHEAGEEGSAHVAPWPAYDPKLIKDDIVTIVVQVNGKVRGQLVAAVDASDDDLTEAAQADPNVSKHLQGLTILKTIVVPRKLVNFVVKP